MAKNWISQFNAPLRTLDALHLAITSINNLNLFTADFKLAESARLFGVEVVMIGNT
jgi:predicted nucleic acid-binding protein